MLLWHVTGWEYLPRCSRLPSRTSLTWVNNVRAGEGNRTLMTSLEGWGSAIELRPRNGSRRRAVAYRVARRCAPGQAALGRARHPGQTLDQSD